jgi:ribosomal protein L17
MLERNLVTSLLLYEAVRTTKKRAEVAQPTVERLITYARTHDPRLAIRHIQRVVTDENACRKLMEVLRERYAKRHSGVTRIVPVGTRKGDGAKLVDFLLVAGEARPPAEAPVAKKKPAKKLAATKSA